ncbi:hypothetical protein CJF42_24295 [Pseudoalteromonas sp. NBT06-2]|uniref:hypothetical protein n=1 Tax=Pseudoalteromonas sp. NBT06-2 TaxID=2025950 RepID=UPI000BA4F135|nr:hypothetical protein [Pseudoalteromonas sp. NBT06-2]PAJ71880.1 hypothetical protein CJF42_24295 [Pseudoalteromonas sp. NBT06-2]
MLKFRAVIMMAFFMSFFSDAVEPDMSDLKSPTNEPTYKADYNGGLVSYGDTKQLAFDAMCQKWGQRWIQDAVPPDNKYSFTGECIYDGKKAKVIKYQWDSWNNVYKEYPQTKKITHVNIRPVDSERCPHPDFLDYVLPVPDPTNPEKIMCAKPLIEEPHENDDDCPQLGDVSNFSFGGANQTMCFANSNNPDTTKTCNYTSDDSGMYNLPDLGAQEPIACNDGDSNNDNGEDKPNPPDLDEDGCFTAQNGKYCAKDPDDVCDVETGIEGHTAYNCNEGCGKVTVADGSTGFYCTDENNDDGLPTLDCSDTEYAEVNADICAVDNNTDKDGDGITDTKDTVQGLNELKQGQKEGNAKLNEISQGIDGLGKKQGEANKLLKDLKSNSKASNELLSTISENTFSTQDQLKKMNETNIENAFDPSQSNSFYEREYTNGVKGIWTDKAEAFKQTEFVTFLNQFNPSIQSAAPDFSMCFDLGFVNFGCVALPLPTTTVMAFIKIVILISAAFLCRYIIFGG